MNCYCSFCASAGVAGPHDHFLRASKAQGSKVTCPKLKETQCGHCGRKGHTARYCGESALAKKVEQAAALAAKKARFQAGDWQDVGGRGDHMRGEHPGFESPRVSRKRIATPSAPDKLASRFGALDIESDEEEKQEKVVEPPSGPTWAQVAQVAQGVAKEAAEDGDEELPPLTWGKINTARWGDVTA